MRRPARPEGPEDFRIWDLHTHFAGLPGATPEAKMARLMAYADRLGIERLVVFMGDPMVADEHIAAFGWASALKDGSIVSTSGSRK